MNTVIEEITIFSPNCEGPKSSEHCSPVLIHVERKGPTSDSTIIKAHVRFGLTPCPGFLVKTFIEGEVAMISSLNLLHPIPSHQVFTVIKNMIMLNQEVIMNLSKITFGHLS